MMLRLQELGSHNINFVTPSHVVPQILEALVVAAEQGPGVLPRREVIRVGRGHNGGQFRGVEGARHAVSNAGFFKKLAAAGNKSAVSNVIHVWPLAKGFSRFFVNLFSFSGVYTIEYW